MTAKAKCWLCEERHECWHVTATTGGDYRRGPTNRKVNLCLRCITRVAAAEGWSHERVDTGSARHVLGRLFVARFLSLPDTAAGRGVWLAEAERKEWYP